MYSLSGRKILFDLCAVMAIFALTGCQASAVTAVSKSSAQAVDESNATQQLIIKFRPTTIACDVTGIAQLSSATKVTLAYVRPMSGDACVIRQLPDEAHDFVRGQELLRQHPAVEWLEPDAKKRAQ